MTSSLTLSCQCGKLNGELRSYPEGSCKQVVCYCRDCRAFIRHLECTKLLNSNGGVELYQISPARVHFSSGLEQLGCLRLAPGGALRWYAVCCETPIGTTLKSRYFCFISLNKAIISDEYDADAELRIGRKSQLAQHHVFGKYALGDTAGRNISQGVPLSLMLSGLFSMIRRLIRGDHRSNHFFSASTEKTRVDPVVLSVDVRQALSEADVHQSDSSQ